MKYYFLTAIRESCIKKDVIVSGVVKQHPFIFLNNKEKEYHNTYVLLNYKEITKDEYDLYLKLNKD
jgi:hypothetical protein